MSDTIDGRLAALGISLPEAAAPAANYVPYVISGNLLFLSGQLPIEGGKVAVVGLAFLAYARHAADGEMISLQGSNLVVELETAGRLERAEFSRQWVRVEPKSGDQSLIELSGQGQTIEVGRFVRPELRQVLAREIRKALRSA